MPIHIDQVVTDIALFDGELPLSDAQIERIVALVAARLEAGRRDERERRAATSITRTGVLPEDGP
jgi:hypothetical protein